MKVVLHDFSGHPFQADLSRKLAEAGHVVDHVTADQYVSGKGHLSRQPGDSPNLTFTGVRLTLPFQKYAPWARLRFERAYGRAWVKQLKRSPRPDAVITCNLPLISMYLFARHARRTRLRYLMWHQDIYSRGLGAELHRRLPGPLARLGTRLFVQMEAYCTRHAAHVVAIGEAFTYVYPAWKVDPARVSVIPNWAPLDRVYPVARENPRADDLFRTGTALRLLYAGTLGRKHNPRLLLELLRGVLDNGISAAMVVVSEGEAADELAQDALAAGLPLTVHPFQPADDLPEVLGAADVLVALLEPDATSFSIPSKVLSYMAAGRPILGLMPADNPAAMDIAESGGVVVDPSQVGVTSAVWWLTELATHPALVQEIGVRTRATAERKFDIAKVADEFQSILMTDELAAARQ